MTLFFTEQQAQSTLDIQSVVAALRETFDRQAKSQVTNLPRIRSSIFDRSLNIMTAFDLTTRRYAVKIYGGGMFHILLYSQDSGLLATMEADWLGQLRTGGTNALAASLMARKGAKKVGLIGAGRQAFAQMIALEAIDLMDEVTIFARRREALEAFCKRLSNSVKAEVRIAKSPRGAVESADIVVTATNSAKPVVRHEWLREGTHINAMGANSASRMELEPDTVLAASLLVTDDLEQARTEAAEFIALGDRLDWSKLKPLHKLVEDGDRGPRDPRAITVFKSLGAGLEDLAIASLLYDRSRL